MTRRWFQYIPARREGELASDATFCIWRDAPDAYKSFGFGLGFDLPVIVPPWRRVLLDRRRRVWVRGRAHHRACVALWRKRRDSSRSRSRWCWWLSSDVYVPWWRRTAELSELQLLDAPRALDAFRRWETL